MKKLICISILLLFVTSLYSDLQIIQFSTIPNIKELEQQILFVINNESLLKSPIPEKYWQSKISREELIMKLKSLYSNLDKLSIEVGINQDLLLLKGIIAHYLYNLFVSEYYQIAIDNFTKVENIKNHDYRFKWLLGNHYIKSAKPFDSIKCFEYVAERIPEERLHPLFWEDYAVASILALMPMHGLSYFEKYSKYGKISLSDNSLYNQIKKNYKQPEFNKTISSNELYLTLNRENNFGYLFRPFGIWFTLKEDWQVKNYDFTNDRSYFAIKPDRIKNNKGIEIGYTIFIEFKVNNNISFDQYIEDAISIFPEIKKSNSIRVNLNCTIFEFRDKTKYVHIGGSHGYYIFFKRESPEKIGYSIEKPSKLSEEFQGTAYFSLKEPYTRFPGTIYYAILLDTCEDIFSESKKVFSDFINNILLE